ncbi:tetratricopeptide repeat protein [Polynucleobacter sp. JS-Polo-80-F4]|uniref:tetratricopeptide repeat protein n=1 Tax=Polynucleobacter sp. JS-Polo-80-F4 TaxID=2576918 RepID=UPI001C0B4C5A|nr:tetratricopeptide repeat protein [Polynucleobacter sp. JS-Polo-80-F4]MBU3617288.1 tetratricopeptide repeat protein [Polynucleobacter sp. JS-Polo-80-F4]
MQNRSIRIFLSSTFRDYGEERDLLVRKVFPNLRAKLKDRFVELVDVDLRWGITVQQAERGEVLPICLAEIDRARPFFVGMLGDRYGWIPPKDAYAPDLVERQPWLDSHRGGKSVTELEMLHGVLNNPKMAGRALFYFRSSSYAKQKGGVYLPESPADHERQQKLKARISKHRFPVVRYQNPEAFAKRLEKDLWKLLDKEFPASSVPDAYTREGLKHESYAAPRRRLYLGGEKYLAALGKAVQNKESKILIVGSSGGGKSALIANWLQSYRAKHPKHLVFEYYLGASTDSADPAVLVRRLIETIKRITGSNEEVAGDPQKLYDSLPAWLAAASAYAGKRKTSWVIALDSLNSLTQLQDLRWLPQHLPPHITLMISTLPGEVNAALLTKVDKKQRWHTIQVKPLTSAERKNLLVTYLAKYNKTLAPDLLKQALAHPLSNNPLFIRTLAEELRLFGVHEELQKRLKHYLTSKTIDDLFERVLKRVEGDSGKQAVQLAMQSIWAARAGLTEKEILAIVGLKPATWAPIRNALDECLLESNGKITFAHDYMRIAVKDRFLKTKQLQKQAHIDLAKYFQKQIADARRAEEEPYQWQRAEEWDSLRKCLVDKGVFDYLLRRKDRSEILAYWLDVQKQLDCRIDGEIKKLLRKWKLIKGSVDDARLIYGVADFLRYSSLHGVALQFGELALQLIQETLGAKHPEYFKAGILIGDLLIAESQYDKARKFIEKLLKQAEKIFGKTSLQVAELTNCLSTMYYGASDYIKASALTKATIEMRSKLLGNSHPDTVTARNNLANIQEAMSEFESAIALHQDCLARYRQIYGAQSSWYALSLNNLASALEKAGKLDEAVQYFRQSIQIYEDLLGPYSSDILLPISNLGLLLPKLGMEKEGVELCRRALQICERVFGENNAETARLLINIASLLYDPVERKPLILRAYRICQDMLGEHRITAVCLSFLASIYDQEDDLDLAEKYYLESLEMAQRIYGDEGYITADCMFNVGNFYSNNFTDVTDTALKYYRRALEIKQIRVGVDSPHLCPVMFAIADAEENLEQFEQAKKIYQEIYRIIEKNFGLESIQIINCLARLADIDERDKQYQSAEELYLRAYRLSSSHYGESADLTGILSERLGRLYLTTRRFDQSEKYLNEALKITQKCHGKHSAENISPLKNLANLLIIQGNGVAARPLLDQALLLAKANDSDDLPKLEKLVEKLNALNGK